MMKNNGYELHEIYYKNFKRGIIAFLVALLGFGINFFGWYVIENPILMLIGAIMVILALVFAFSIFFYGVYLIIRLLFAKWPRQD
jgi:uncharacterized membrane protein